MQQLVKEKLKLDIDRTYADGGERPRQVAVGGGVIEFSPGRPPKPLVHRRGKTFIYDDGTPVTRLEDVEHLPTREVNDGTVINPRAMAEAFVRAQTGDQPTPRRPGKKGQGGVRLSAADDPRKVRKQAPPRPEEINLDRQLGGAKAGRKPVKVSAPDDE